MNYQDWINRLKTVVTNVHKIGGEVEPLIIKEPASESQIKDIEDKLRCSLPISYKKFLLEFSSYLEWRWGLPDEMQLPDKFDELFGGIGSVGLSELLECETIRKESIEIAFDDPNHQYDKVWHNKLAFFAVGNGDILAFDLSIPVDPPVVYVSHDDGEGHGYILGHNFIDFMDRWSKIGFVGGEDWQLLPFIESSTSGINPDSTNSKEWRELIGLSL